MSNSDPYIAPSADLQTGVAAIKTSIWSAKGRLGAISYFAQSVSVTLVFLVLFGGVVGLGILTGETGGIEGGVELNGVVKHILPLLTLPILVLSIYFTFCLIIKRLHDRDHAGWWSLLSLIPLVNIIAGIYITFAHGQKHPNRYGGQRTTKGWERAFTIIFIVLLVVALVGGIAALVISS